jgi:hypothetical protein
VAKAIFPVKSISLTIKSVILYFNIPGIIGVCGFKNSLTPTIISSEKSGLNFLFVYSIYNFMIYII